jgi:hypothetical protein
MKGYETKKPERERKERVLDGIANIIDTRTIRGGSIRWNGTVRRRGRRSRR